MTSETPAPSAAARHRWAADRVTHHALAQHATYRPSTLPRGSGSDGLIPWRKITVKYSHHPESADPTAISNWPSPLGARLSMLSWGSWSPGRPSKWIPAVRIAEAPVNGKAPRSQTNHLVMDAARGTALLHALSCFTVDLLQLALSRGREGGIAMAGKGRAVESGGP